MKYLYILIGLIVIIGGFLYWNKTSEASIGNLNLYSGTAEVVRDEITISGKTGSIIKNTDIIKVAPDSRVSIILKDGSVIRLEALSEVEVVSSTNFKLKSGKMWSRVEPLAAGSSYSVETPTIVASVRGTQFNTRYSDNSSGISVYMGKVGVALLSNIKDEKVLIAGNQFILSDTNLEADFAQNPIIMNPEKYDSWIIFNLSEDAKIDGEEFTPTSPDKNPPKEIIIKPLENKREVISLLLYGNKSKIKQGEETKILIRAKYSDNSSEEVPFNLIQWLKSEKWGTITAPGYFSSNTTGTTTIKAQFAGMSSNQVTIVVEALPNPIPPPNPNTYYEGPQ